MEPKVSVTILRPLEQVERLWRDQAPLEQDATFRPAPGDRGTEIHVALPSSRNPLSDSGHAQVKNALRRFKARVEIGEVPRSEGSPEGESVERKLKQRPAQPLSADDLQQVS